MDAIATHLAAAMDIEFNVRLVAVAKNNDHWRLIDDRDHVHETYDAVIVALPPPQAAKLLDSSSKLHDRITRIEMQPCLAVMAAFEKQLDLPFDAAFVHKAPVRWAARNNSKPGRPAAECWVFHASAQWSRSHAGRDDGHVAKSLLGSYFESIGHRHHDPVYQYIRYWKSAAAVNPLSVGCLWDAESRIGCCGDWCQMSRLEGAALSGMAMAGRVSGIKAGMGDNMQDPKK
jgi:predicted NAD/FAD-dependent oxidoreductase